MTRLAAYSGISRDCLAIYFPNFLLKAGVVSERALSDTDLGLGGREDMMRHTEQGFLHGSHKNDKGSGRAAVMCVCVGVSVLEKRYFSAGM